MSNPSGMNRFGALLLLVLLGAGIALLVWVNRDGPAPAEQPVSVAPEPAGTQVPAFTESQFLNVGPGAHYIGSAACAGCHPDNYQSFLRTPHSRAFGDVDPKTEPADGSFRHQASSRTYRVYRTDGQIRHEEVLRTSDGEEIGRVDLPVRYVVGSGNYTRSYLVEVDGFLHESPITWYQSGQKWGMSPGYDVPNPVSFERPATLACLSCHVGRAEEAAGKIHQYNFHEKAIGCENCHGPGSLHQDRQRTNKPPLSETDLTIVHPGRLSRPLLESVCAVCHQSEAAAIVVRGRAVNDFRPGRPLSDYRVQFEFDRGNDRMAVVGHVDQMHQSACYKKSDVLTCVTCHDPHRRETLKDKSAFYRTKCLSCHETQPCKLDAGTRLKKEKDNCVACHMPSGDTEIPHIAFTNHRIGHHASKAVEPVNEMPELVFPQALTRFEPLDRERNLGLAYVRISQNPSYRRFAMAYRTRARGLLEHVTRAGITDPDTLLGLAYLDSESNGLGASRLARQILEQDPSPEVRGMALMVIAMQDARTGYVSDAVRSLEQLTRLRRLSQDWGLLGQCYAQQNDPEKALSSLRHALEIRPYRASITAGLADLYRKQGDSKAADLYQRKTQWLRSHQLE